MSDDETQEGQADATADAPTGAPIEAETDVPAAAGAPEAGAAEATDAQEAPGSPDASAGATDAPVAEAAGEAAASGRRDRSERRGQPRRQLGELRVGERMKGKVVGLAKFGAFVDIGASTDGLVHLTELPGKRVANVEEVLKSGDAVEVWVKEVNLGTGRISLSMKAPTENPMAKLAVGDVLTGTVTTITKYGVFVDIRSDTEGLVHISEMSSGYVSRPEDVAKPGEAVEVRVKEIDGARKRISLSMIGLANDAGPGPEADEGRGRSGGRGGRGQSAEDDYAMPEEPEERHPTVVELALRRALGQEGDDEPAAAGKKAGGKRERKAALTDVYARMLEEYRDSNG